MSNHNDNDDNDFVDNVLNADDDDDNEDDDQDDVDVHMALMMMMMTMSMSTMMIHFIILLDTAKLNILELITSNSGCEVFTIKILLVIGFYID